MHPIISSCIAAFAVVGVWLIIDLVFCHLINDTKQGSYLLSLAGDAKPNYIIYVLLLPVVAILHYFVPAIWFWGGAAVSTIAIIGAKFL